MREMCMRMRETRTNYMWKWKDREVRELSELSRRCMRVYGDMLKWRNREGRGLQELSGGCKGMYSDMLKWKDREVRRL